MNPCTRISVASAVVLSISASLALGQNARGRPDGVVLEKFVDEGDYVSDVDLLLRNVRSRPSASSVVIPSAAVQFKQLARTVEELEIMSRILDKAVGRKPPASRFDRVLWNVKGSRVEMPETLPRAFLLDGYGALLMTSVDYPLTPPENKSQETGEAPPKESVWEKTRRELYGPIMSPATGGGIGTHGYESMDGTQGYESIDEYGEESSDGMYGAMYGMGGAGAPARKPYDAKKVEALKTTLLETLKQATNIRSLMADESVTLVVLGAPRPGLITTSLRVDEGDFIVGAVAGGRPTVLTLRVKKPDVDAFAQGQLSLEEFSEKTTILAY
ncbi:MAG: hypothetical protein ACYTG0_32210 [Planctomycetota bacterium]|jgi:hypothetical protein